MVSAQNDVEHIDALDGLRGVAALMVIFFHSPVPLFQLEFGWAGVNLFYILSGFLITSILISTRQKPFRVYIRTFYTRRVLRIFPLYFFYLLLVFCLLLIMNKGLPDGQLKHASADMHNNSPYLLTFTYNFATVFNFLAGRDYHNSVFTGHLWTLSVEVQFYAVFAIVVYFLRIRLLKIGCVFLMVITPFLRLLAVLHFEHNHYPPFWTGTFLYNFTLFQLDSLALGACLVLFDLERSVKKGTLYLTLLIGLLVVIGAIHLCYLNGQQLETSSLGYDAPVYHIAKQPSPCFILNNRYFYTIPVINLTFGLLLLLLVKKRINGWCFNNRYLIALGRISYGTYLYHLPVGYFFSLLINVCFGKGPGQFNWLYQCAIMAIFLAGLFLLAGLSYKYFERRFTVNYK